MANIPYRVSQAQERLTSASDLARIVWVINLTASVISIYYRQYEMAAITGFTFAATLAFAGLIRRAIRLLKPIVRASESPRMVPLIEDSMMAPYSDSSAQAN